MEYKGYDFRVRRLTPRECFRLMGWGKKVDGVWHDDDFERAASVCSSSQLYKQAGNGIVCKVIERIGEQMLDKVPEMNLVELFGGIGCQRRGFLDAGMIINSKGYCDFDKFATASYNAIYGESNLPSDITKLKAEDLFSDNTNVPTMWTYSFPCTDLSVAGAQKMMSREDYLNGNGTRSGLLWEVERILTEIANSDGKYQLPQFLLMENVSQVHGRKNAESWKLWLDFLSSLGYTSKWADLNAREHGIPQNRVRTFMLSSLGDLDWFSFPQAIPLEECMADYLDDEVEEKYYINAERSDMLLEKLANTGELDKYVG